MLWIKYKCVYIHLRVWVKGTRFSGIHAYAVSFSIISFSYFQAGILKRDVEITTLRLVALRNLKENIFFLFFLSFLLFVLISIILLYLFDISLFFTSFFFFSLIKYLVCKFLRFKRKKLIFFLVYKKTENKTWNKSYK